MAEYYFHVRPTLHSSAHVSLVHYNVIKLHSNAELLEEAVAISFPL